MAFFLGDTCLQRKTRRDLMKDGTYRFAKFELKLPEGELRSEGSVIKLQEKPLLLLCTLLEHSPHIVSREQLRERMWDRRTVVDYEQGINVAIKKVRSALSDSAAQPKLIETVARKGYRLLVAVEEIDGFDRDSAPSPVQPVASTLHESVQRRRRRLQLTAATAVAGVLALAIGLFSYQQRRSVQPRQIQALAVLPLRNLSPDRDQDYFADGITDEITTNLAQTLPLRVISRTSVQRYQNTDKPIRQIAGELGVDALVEGTVQRSGDKVSINVQLIDATEDRHLWAEKYERRIDDVFHIEDELSRAIAETIGGKLVARPPTADPHSVDPKVYELLLLGRYHLSKRSAVEMDKAENYFRQLLELDPSYAPAYAGLADIYLLRPSYDAVQLTANFDKAERSARRAIELDDTLADPHATLGLIHLNTDQNPVSSEAEFSKALALNPNHAKAHHWFAYHLLFFDKPERALAEIETARQLDPLSVIINADAGHMLCAARHYDEARDRLKRAIELQPDLGQPHSTLALVEFETNHPAEAIKEAHIGLTLDPHNSRTMAEAGYVLASTGRTEEARRLLDILDDLAGSGLAPFTMPAMVNIGLGQRDAALASLARVPLTQGGAAMRGLNQWHAFDQISNDSRFKQLQARTH
jgi:TolB-like protein/DNA-binding winged helix-turn-helix (wHTH) protein/Flp pilus assembly protein TadD